MVKVLQEMRPPKIVHRLTASLNFLQLMLLGQALFLQKVQSVLPAKLSKTKSSGFGFRFLKRRRRFQVQLYQIPDELLFAEKCRHRNILRAHKKDCGECLKKLRVHRACALSLKTRCLFLLHLSSWDL